jgi:hypothetical protein
MHRYRRLTVALSRTELDAGLIRYAEIFTRVDRICPQLEFRR